MGLVYEVLLRPAPFLSRFALHKLEPFICKHPRLTSHTLSVTHNLRMIRINTFGRIYYKSLQLCWWHETNPTNRSIGAARRGGCASSTFRRCPIIHTGSKELNGCCASELIFTSKYHAILSKSPCNSNICF